ncbi:MAG: non-ribosomal peptide synthetase [Janthinobacterium lividum]
MNILAADRLIGGGTRDGMRKGMVSGSPNATFSTTRADGAEPAIRHAGHTLSRAELALRVGQIARLIRRRLAADGLATGGLAAGGLAADGTVAGDLAKGGSKSLPFAAEPGGAGQGTGGPAGKGQEEGEILVGLCIDRSADQVAAVLGILHAGCAVLPLDPAWPDARRTQLLALAGTRYVVGRTDPESDRSQGQEPRGDGLSGEGGSGGAASGITTIDLRDVEPAAPDMPCDLDRPLDGPGGARPAAALACVIYTSGSSGVPKGVEITHGNLRHLLAWHQAAFAPGPQDRVSHLAGLGFDAALWEVLAAVSAGACLTLPPDAVRTDALALQAWLVEEAVTIAFVPTVLATPLLHMRWPAHTALRRLLTGGEALPARPLPALPFTVVNNYGPAECTVVTTSAVVPAADPGDAAGLPPIGWPVAGASVRLVDEAGQTVADGEVGEIEIGGAGVGRGYHRRPDLTRAAFLVGEDGGWCYRSGDLGRRRPDGQIAFHGRRDAQEKLRGNRVEPAEVAAVLRGAPGLSDCAVVGHGEPGARRLVAYIVPAGNAPVADGPVGDGRVGDGPAIASLAAFVAARLPAYMVPEAWVMLPALPLTASGKLDRSALPEPGAATPGPGADDGHASPRAGSLPGGEAPGRMPEGPVEERLAVILGTLLPGRRIAATDNFFLLGGHSLLATQAVLQARAAFDVELTLLHLFEAATIERLAATIEAMLIDKISAMSEDDVARLMGE